MAPPKRPWFRFYTEALTDPKLRRLSPEERWLWVAVLGAARRSPMPGHLMLTESLPMEADDLAELAGMTAARVEKGLAKMVDLGIVTFHGDRGWRVPKWNERQFESDEVSKRTAKHRSKNAQASTKERSNVDEGTPPETEDRDRVQSSDVEGFYDDDGKPSTDEGGSSSWTDDQLFREAGQVAARCHVGEFTTSFDDYATGAGRRIKRERGYLARAFRDKGFTLSQAAFAIAQRDAESFLTTDPPDTSELDAEFH